MMNGFNNLPGITAEMARVVEDALYVGAAMIQSEVKVSMAKAKHGRTYALGSVGLRGKSGKRKGTAARLHRASAPGEAPAILSGMLTNSIMVSSTPFKRVIYTNQEYAQALEAGNGALEARPFMEPAATKSEKKIQMYLLGQLLRYR